MSKPSVKTNPPAKVHAGKDERIVEFHGGQPETGGLISLRVVDGILIVELYRLDANIQVRAPLDKIAPPT